MGFIRLFGGMGSLRPRKPMKGLSHVFYVLHTNINRRGTGHKIFLKMKKIVLLIASTAIFAGCATIICGTTQSVNFTSSPSSATIYDNGMQIGKTPLSAELSRKKEHAITIKLDGYKDYEILIKQEFNAWYIGNIMFGGMIGLIVDPLTGAMYRLTPNQISAELEGQATSFKQTVNDIYIAVSLHPNPAWECIGALESL